MPLYTSQFNPAQALRDIAKQENALAGQNLAQQAQQDQIQQNQLNAQLAQALQPLKMQQAQLDLQSALQKQEEDKQLAPLRLQQLRNALDPNYQLAQKRRELELSQQFAPPVPLSLDINGKQTQGMWKRDPNAPGGFSWEPIDVTRFANPESVGLEQPPFAPSGPLSEPVPETPQVESPTVNTDLGTSLQNLGGANLPVPSKIVPRATIPRVFAGTAYKPGAASGTPLTPEGLALMGSMYNLTGSLAGLGPGGTAAKIQAINEAAKQQSESGKTVSETVANQSQLKADQASLKKLETQKDQVLSFAKTFDKNLEVALDLSNKVGRGGVPVFNRWILAGRRSIAGDPEVAAFDVANKAAADEFGKLTSSATGGGVTSDSARLDAEAKLNAAQTPEQYRAVVEVLKKDRKNREDSFNEQLGQIRGSISGKPVLIAPPTPTGPLPITQRASELLNKYGVTTPSSVVK